MTTKPLFNEYGYYIGPTIPDHVVDALTNPGVPADAEAKYWRQELNFEVPRDKAIKYLSEFGAWSTDELNAMSDDDIAEIVLWIACGDTKENGDWYGLSL